MSTFAYRKSEDLSEFEGWERDHCENLLRRLRFLEKQLTGEDLEFPSTTAVKKAGNELKALRWILWDNGFIDRVEVPA